MFVRWISSEKNGHHLKRFAVYLSLNWIWRDWIGVTFCQIFSVNCGPQLIEFPYILLESSNIIDNFYVVVKTMVTCMSLRRSVECTAESAAHQKGNDLIATRKIFWQTSATCWDLTAYVFVARSMGYIDFMPHPQGPDEPLISRTDPATVFILMKYVQYVYLPFNKQVIARL